METDSQPTLDSSTLYEWSVRLKACEVAMAVLMKKMADEICGSLELMRGEAEGEEEQILCF